MTAQDIINEIESANSDGQHWLSVDMQPQDDGTVVLVVDVHGHFAVTAASDAPEAVAEGIGCLFDSMAAHVKRASGGVVGDCTASHPAAGQQIKQMGHPKGNPAKRLLAPANDDTNRSNEPKCLAAQLQDEIPSD